MTEARPASGSTNNPRIDRLRGIFAICVASGHTYDLARLQASDDFATTVISGIRIFLGFTWVVAFIVMSGYCIARSSMNPARRFSFWRYLLLRVTRIYPLLIGCALIAGLFEYTMFGSPSRPNMWAAGINLLNLRAALLGMSGFYSQFGSYAPSYTVSYELLYYLLFGLVFAIVGRPGATIIVGFLLAGILYAASARFGPLLVGQLGPVLTDWVLMFFIVWLMGAALFYFEDRIRNVVRGIPTLVAWIAWFAYSLAMANYGGHPHYAQAEGASFLFYIGLAAFYALMIATYIVADNPGGPLWLDRWLGEISYPIFVVHGPMLIFTGYLMKRMGIAIGFLPYVVICMCINLLAAHLLAMAIEGPVMRWRKRTLSKYKAVAAPAIALTSN